MRPLNDTNCPIALTLHVLGGRWKARVLWLIAEGTCRFGDLHRTFENISKRMLTLQLRELEDDGIITRHVLQAKPLHVEYRLTAVGESLLPIVNQLNNWGLAEQARRGQQLVEA